MLSLEENPIIAAVHTKEDFEEAVKSELNVIFMMNANILTLQEYTQAAHKNNKKLFVHADMTEGIAKDTYGIGYIAKMGADGIISTRGNIIKMAKEWKLKTVQRFFIIDFHSMNTAIDSIKSQKPDMIEVMPGVVPKVISYFSENTKLPIITGGLIETKQEVIEALKAGATAISTSNTRLWYD